MRRDVLGQPVTYRLVTNGFSMSGTGMMSDRYMKLYVYWPVAVHPGIERRCSSAMASARPPGPSPTPRDLSPSTWWTSPGRSSPWRRVLVPAAGDHAAPGPPRARPRRGRAVLPASTNAQRFDLITAEPPPPKDAGVVNLYSREYFELVHDRLAEGGVATYWLPVFLLEPADTLAIVKAFCSRLRGLLALVGSRLQLDAGGQPWRAVSRHRGASSSRQWRDPRLLPRLREEALESPAIMGTTFLGDAPFLAGLTRDVAPLVDDRPYRVSASPPDPAVAFRYYRSLADADAAQTALRRQRGHRASLAAVPAREDAPGVRPPARPERLPAPSGGRPRPAARRAARGPDADDLADTAAAGSWTGRNPRCGSPTRPRPESAAGGRIDYVRAADALARRDYAAAASRLAALRVKSPDSPRRGRAPGDGAPPGRGLRPRARRRQRPRAQARPRPCWTRRPARGSAGPFRPAP